MVIDERDDPAFDCEACGTILEVGVPHDCPVLGGVVLIRERSA